MILSNSRFSILCLLLLSLLTLLFAQPARAIGPSAVSLVYFRASSEDAGVKLEWRTGTEEDIYSFIVERGSDPSGPFTAVVEREGRGSVAAGATYEHLDQTATSGQRYWYRLVERSYSDARITLETVDLTFTPPPTAVPVTGGGGSAEVTATPPATSTPAAATQPTTQSGAASPTATSSGATAVPPTVTRTPRGSSGASAPTSAAPALSSPTAAPTRAGSVPAAEAAQAATPVAQVTEATQGYPGPEQQTDEQPSTPVGATPPAAGAPLSQEDAYPGPGAPEGAGFPDGSPRGLPGEPAIGASPIGSNASPRSEEAAEPDAQAQESPSGGRLLLWIGFLGALFIFAGGVFFSILISTRRTRDSSRE